MQARSSTDAFLALLARVSAAECYELLRSHGIQSSADVNMLEEADRSTIGLSVGAWRRIRAAAKSAAKEARMAPCAASPSSQQVYLSPRQFAATFTSSPRCCLLAPAASAASAALGRPARGVATFAVSTSHDAPRPGGPSTSLLQPDGDFARPQGSGRAVVHSARAYERLFEADPVTRRELPMRRTLNNLRKISKLKSLISFMIFYVAYVSLSTVRMDYWRGHETLEWLKDAHVNAEVPQLDAATELDQIVRYLDKDMASVVAELKTICEHCGVGLTPQARDMTFLGLDDFVCSDFDSVMGERVYPTRDCETVDAEWAAHPSSLTAPCCSNATLLRASVAMMTEALAYSITALPLDVLLNGGTDPSYSSTEYFVDYYIQEKSFIMQLIVSREQRMAGIEYHVAPRKHDAPKRVEVVPGYWSFNYQAVVVQTLLFYVMVLGGGFTLLHDRRLMVEHFCASPDLERVAERAQDRCSLWREIAAWSRRWSAYTTLIEIPSIVLPLFFELLLPFLELPTWTFWVAFTEMLLSIRMLHEGTLLPALKRLVAIIDEATPNMIALVIVLAPLTALTSLMHSQLFGLFDEGFSDPFVSLSRIVDMLTAPPPAANTEGAVIASQRQGAELLFYWSTFVIRLCFGSFIVAILVGAFNKVVTNEAQQRIDEQRDASLPRGFVDGEERHSCRRLAVFLDFFLTSRLYGSYEPRLIVALETQIALMEMEDESGAAKLTQLMINAEKLADIVGPRPALLLLRAHGATPPGDGGTALDA